MSALSNGDASTRGKEIGIVDMEVYFPNEYVDQNELEQFDGVASGKYTIGLGQSKMGFCRDDEDIHSICLTTVARLMDRFADRLVLDGVHESPYELIGRLDVGSETLVDKSKSIKTVLMDLFVDHKNGKRYTDVEGVDSTNACYGGTAALFNVLSWLQSDAWDGKKLALVVCADIAVYADGSKAGSNARPTGGAGCIAMLIGRDPVVVFDHADLRSSHCEHVYDFFKPRMDSDYPTVDGKLSIECYFRALDSCYTSFGTKYQNSEGTAILPGGQENHFLNLTSFDALLFHTPFCRLVQKSVGRLFLNDAVNGRISASDVDVEVEKLRRLDISKVYFDKDVEKTCLGRTSSLFNTKTEPSLVIAKNVGNMYTASLYASLASHLASTDAKLLAGQRLGLFSYGSGCVATFFTARVIDDVEKVCKFKEKSVDVIKQRLSARSKVTPSEYTSVMLSQEKRKANGSPVPHKPESDLFKNRPDLITYRLSSIDECHRRKYSKWSPPTSHSSMNGHHHT